MFLSGCDISQKHKDVSDYPKFNYLTNTKFETVVGMSFSGFNASPGYGEEVNFYEFEPVPRSGRAELITREVSPLGTVFTIIKVTWCSNCPFDEILKAKIVFDSFKAGYDVSIVIDLDDLNLKHVSKLN